VAFHIEPDPSRFAPGSSLYFVSEGASLNPHALEAVYELEEGVAGSLMPEASAAPSGEATGFYWQRLEREENVHYQSSLLDVSDPWLWDFIFATQEKSVPFDARGLASVSEESRLELWLRGGTDLPGAPDHHVQVMINDTMVAEVEWNGKESKKLSAAFGAGILKEADNRLQILNVGDTGAAFSMILLDRFVVSYPRVLAAEEGRLEGSWSQSGTAEVAGIGDGAHLLDVTNEPVWLNGITQSGFRAEAGRSYLLVTPEAVLRPEVKTLVPSTLKSTENQTDYILVGPRDFLAAAQPLSDWRTEQGLAVMAVSVEEIYQEFGFGEARPEAVQDFIAYAFHQWSAPSPRYVVLLGDATLDPKDYLETGVVNRVVPQMVKTSYMWTVSDPSYVAVNGDDILPDLAIGRLPAESVDEVAVMVAKLLAYESGEATMTGPAVLVADNLDSAGDFEANAEDIASSLLAERGTTKIYLGELGAGASRSAITSAFDQGVSLVSYMGHGGIDLWAKEKIFTNTEIGSLAPQAQQPLVLTLNCLNGYFVFPHFNSLSEELIKAEGKGAIATFSPSGLSLDAPAHLFHKAVLEELVSGGHQRLGDAVLAAQQAYAYSGAFSELLSIYHLFGDPAMELR
jgi:hypothetical protein